jgi:hydrogenase maturation factor/beta-phosphoglucomutase-like phosphatase (HAD superfamily)
MTSMSDRLFLTNRPFQTAAVLFHLEGTLARADERPPQETLRRPDQAPGTDGRRGSRNAPVARRVLVELERREQAAAARWMLHPAAADLFAHIRANGLAPAVFSRHGRKAVDRFLQRVRAALGESVPVPIAREELISIDRRRNPFALAARALRVPIARMLVVSAERSMLDRAAAAGAATVLVSAGPAPIEPAAAVHLQITDLRHLRKIIRLGVPLPPGKLPNDLLKQFIDEFEFEDPSLIIRPGVGQDIAAVDMAQEEVLVLKSDPITFATDSIGQYAVLVNANDIATAGAAPRWFLTTLLFPVGSTPSMIWSVVRELKEFARRWGITLCGGHTEITDAVRRPVVAGMMAGTVRRRDLIDKRRMRTGDRILLTKAVAVEGTAIIAREFGRTLKALGMSAAEIQRCRGFLDSISILPEAGIAAAAEGTSAMHDVTEGGIATALEELSAAGRFELHVDMERIPVFPETRRLSRLLRIDPLGLIGSGSLLICCRPTQAARLEAKLQRKGIRASAIGEVGGAGSGVHAFRGARPVRWRSFEVDEIARLFAREPRVCGRCGK